MSLESLSSSDAVDTFKTSSPFSLILYSATWCGPCKAVKPAFEAQVNQWSSAKLNVKCGLAYESEIGADCIAAEGVSAYPTFILYNSSKEKLGEVKGGDLAKVKALVESNCTVVNSYTGAGNSLGGGGSAVPQTAEERRAASLARFGGNVTKSKPTATVPTPPSPATKATPPSPDVEMVDATICPIASSSSSAAFDPEIIKSLTEEMGFSLIRAQKGIVNGKTLNGALDWLLAHNEDENIDEPMIVDSTGAPVAQIARSYKCLDCGKILSNHANVELHASKTGHENFEESTEEVKPLTPEEKALKIKELKERLAAKRAANENEEKVDEVAREKSRRFMGAETAKTNEQLQAAERKRDIAAKKKQKFDDKAEKKRIMAEIEKDKRERKANGGKLKGKLGIDGYNPDAIQYDVNNGEDEKEGGVEDSGPPKKKLGDLSIDECIEKISCYRAGGDGGKCLKLLSAFIKNLVDKPDEFAKFSRISTQSNAYKGRVKPFIGGKQLLLAVGFALSEAAGDEDTLVLAAERRDDALLASTKEKLAAAMVKYG